MKERRFFDTNVLVYVHDERAPEKRQAARQLLASHMGERSAVFSTQVLQEYFVAAKRKGVSADTARHHVVAYSKLSIVQITSDLILAAIDLHRLHQVSFWDALVLRAARAGGCSVVL